MSSSKFSEIYLDPRNIGALGGIRRFSKAACLDESLAKDWLAGQKTYSLHKPVQFKFPRSKTIVGGINEVWQLDLIETGSVARQNGGVRYLLSKIDVFSRVADAIPIKTKRAGDIPPAFDKLVSRACGNYPLKVQTDKGGEFLNKKFLNHLKEKQIIHYTSENYDVKCSLVERWNRTIKNKIYRWFTYTGKKCFIDVLDNMIDAYNHSTHSVRNSSGRCYIDQPISALVALIWRFI